MANLRLRFVVEDMDRHGNIRRYFRRKGQPKTRLVGQPGSAQFMAAYQAALSEVGNQPRQHRSTIKGSFGFVCRAYFASVVFKSLDPSTQQWRRRALDQICDRHGDKPIASLQPKHVRILRDELADRPGAARNRLKALRALFCWATEVGEASVDPTIGVKAIRYLSKGHHSWTLEDVAAFEACHPIGTKARLAMALMLYTACRREDAVRLGPQHIQNGRLRYFQAKNEHRIPVYVDIPLYAELAQIISATPSGQLTLLATDYRRPFSAAGFGNRFREWCNQAGLRHCSAHGLRKATAARLAEAGATAHEIMAITGHRSLAEVERYTRAARTPKLADAGMSKLKW
jgi:integrase/recombinase XerD